MRRVGEIAVFAAASVAAHLAVWAAVAPGGAAGGAGQGGVDGLTLAGSSSELAELVAAWDAPPASSETPRQMLTPDVEPAVTGLVQERETSAGTPLSPARPMGPGPEMLPVTDASPPLMPAPRAASRPPAPRPGLVAAGSGGGETAGLQAPSAQPGLSEAERRTLMAAWGAEIRARVEAHKPSSRTVRGEGRTVIRITVRGDGALEEARVVSSARNPVLDEAAMLAVRRAGRFPAAPEGLRLARASFDLPVTFTR